MPGTLFVVATPIGNLEDLTFRALRTLREVRLIAAEDTRRTAKLLAHYEIRSPMVSLREHNEARETPRLLARLEAGDDVALVSDAGTPGISDPGARLVRAALDRHLKVTPIPGPSAVAAALSASGLPADQFSFLGFPPSSGSDRKRWFEALKSEDRTAVFFEAPHRILRTLEEAGLLLVNRPIIVLREVSKINEELVEYPKLPSSERGEFTVVVGKESSAKNAELLDEGDVQRTVAAVGYLTEKLGIEPEQSKAIVATALRLPLPAVRQAVKKARYRHGKGDDGPAS